MEDNTETGISLTVLYQGQEYHVSVVGHQYHSLMSLITMELSIPGFALCNGMGSCGTCSVLINGRPAMACEVTFSHSLNGAYIEIDESRF